MPHETHLSAQAVARLTVVEVKLKPSDTEARELVRHVVHLRGYHLHK